MRAVDMGAVSPSQASSVKPGRLRRGGPKAATSLAGSLEFLLEFTGELNESRRKTNILVERIAVIVA